MKLVLVFMINFNFAPNEKNVLEYILDLYSEYYHQEKHTKKGKGKQADTKPNVKKLNVKLQTIFSILQEQGIHAGATIKDIHPTLEKHIAEALDIHAELNETFVFDETLAQKKALVYYTLFGQKFQILIQYCGHVAKLYFHNMVKCVRCYIQDGKAWSIFVMKHDFGDINQNKVLSALEIEQIFTTEYNDNLEDKKIRDNDIKFDGYLWPTASEVDNLFTTEIDQVSIFKERPTTGKSKKEAILLPNTDKRRKSDNMWDFAENNSVLSGILDSEQKWKAIYVVQSWHKEIKNKIIPKENLKDNEVMEETKNKEKTKKSKRRNTYTERGEDELNVKVEVKVNGTNLFSDSPSSALFHDETLQGHYVGILVKAKDPLPPELAEDLRPLNLKIGELHNLPVDLLSQYGVTRIHACIEFEDPLTNIKTIPQYISEDISLNFFKMTPFMNIKNHQQFLSAFYLKQMTIQLIGEIEKVNEEDPIDVVEEVHEEQVVVAVTPTKVQTVGPRKHGKKNKNKKKSSLRQGVEEEKAEEEVEEYLAIETFQNTDGKQKNLYDELFDSDESVKEDAGDENQGGEKLKIPQGIILSENNRTVLIRICLFRANLTSLVRSNQFNRIQEKLTPSAVFDKDPPNLHSEGENKELQDASLEVNLPQSKEVTENTSNESEDEMTDTTSSRQRKYLIGVDYDQKLTMDFDFYIHAPFQSLCKEYYQPEDNGLNNILVLSRDKEPVNKLVRHIQKYNSRTETLESSADSPSTNDSNSVTGFSLQFADVAIVFTEAIIKSPFPLLLKWVLKFRDSFDKIIYNTDLIIPERMYPELLNQSESEGLFTYESSRNFRDALRRKDAPHVLVDLGELIHVRSIENCHKYQLLPDMNELNSLYEAK